VFDHCWNFEKADLSVRVLKRDVGFKMSDVKSFEKLEFENVLTRIFWEERGEKLMTCHLFLDNFSWNFMTSGWFSKVKSFETDFCFRKTRISWIWYHEIFVLSESCLSQKTFLLRKIDCVFVLAIRGLLHMNKNFVSRSVILRFNHSLRNLFLWKVSFETTLSWCCRKHVFVFEIVSLKGLSEFMIKLSFSLWLLGKRFEFAIMDKVWKLFRFGRWLSFCWEG